MDNYEPYGPEWVKEMKKLPKEFLIGMIKKCNQDKSSPLPEKEQEAMWNDALWDAAVEETDIVTHLKQNYIIIKRK